MNVSNNMNMQIGKMYDVVTNTAFVGYMLIWDTGYFTLLVE